MQILKIIALLIEYPDELLWENRDEALSLVEQDAPMLLPFAQQHLSAAHELAGIVKAGEAARGPRAGLGFELAPLPPLQRMGAKALGVFVPIVSCHNLYNAHG